MPNLDELRSRQEELKSELDKLNQEISQARRIEQESGGFSRSGSNSTSRPSHLVQLAQSKRNVRRPWK